MAGHQDIKARDDIEHIINDFYETLLNDAAIGFFFTDIAKLDLEKHLPKVVNFWEQLLLGTKHPRSNLYETHHQLHLKTPLNQDHFNWWLHLFNKAIDANSRGPVADKMKTKAAVIAKQMSGALTKAEPYQGQAGLTEYTPD